MTKRKVYGLHQFNSEGENKFYVPISDEVKPKIIKDHGCRVTLEILKNQILRLRLSRY